MARIIESFTNQRRVIKLSTNDILSIVRDYQRIVPRGISSELVREYLDDTVIYLPEDL